MFGVARGDRATSYAGLRELKAVEVPRELTNAGFRLHGNNRILATEDFEFVDGFCEGGSVFGGTVLALLGLCNLFDNPAVRVFLRNRRAVSFGRNGIASGVRVNRGISRDNAARCAITSKSAVSENVIPAGCKSIGRTILTLT